MASRAERARNVIIDASTPAVLFQLKTSESQFTVLASDDAESGRAPYANHSVSVVCGTTMDGGGGGAAGSGVPPPHRQTQHNTMSSRSSNGSVITLTMHNNHLIVEKEEIVESVSTFISFGLFLSVWPWLCLLGSRLDAAAYAARPWQ